MKRNAFAFLTVIAMASTATAQVIINEDFSGLADGPATDPFTGAHTWTQDAGLLADFEFAGEAFQTAATKAGGMRWVSAITPVDLSAVSLLTVEWDWTPLNSRPPDPDALMAIELSDSTNQGAEFFRLRIQNREDDEVTRLDSAQFFGANGVDRMTGVLNGSNNAGLTAIGDTYRMSVTVTQTDLTMTVTNITAGSPGTPVDSVTTSFTGGLVKAGVEVWNQVEIFGLGATTLFRIDNIFVALNGAVPIPPEPTPTPIPAASVEEWSLYK